MWNQDWGRLWHPACPREEKASPSRTSGPAASEKSRRALSTLAITHQDPRRYHCHLEPPATLPKKLGRASVGASEGMASPAAQHLQPRSTGPHKPLLISCSEDAPPFSDNGFGALHSEEPVCLAETGDSAQQLGRRGLRGGGVPCGKDDAGAGGGERSGRAAEASQHCRQRKQQLPIIITISALLNYDLQITGISLPPQNEQTKL